MKHYLYTTTTPERETITVLRREDGAQIPMDEANADYRAYLAWVAEGNTAEPWDPTPVDAE
jgi:hypothetical protein